MFKFSKIAIGVLWPIPSLIIWFFALAYTDHSLEFTTPSTILFYAYIVWYFTIITAVYIFLITPYFLIFKNKIIRLILVLILMILLITTFRSSRFNKFIPSIPIYPGGHDIKYEYLRSGIGEGAPNYLTITFSVPNGSSIQERKKVAEFYTSVFLKRGLEFKTAHFSPLTLLNCEEEIDYEINHPEIKGGPVCQLRKLNDSHSPVILFLSFSDDKVSISN